MQKLFRDREEQLDLRKDTKIDRFISNYFSFLLSQIWGGGIVADRDTLDLTLLLYCMYIVS